MTVIWENSQEKAVTITSNRPYIILNAAMTLDGKIATLSRDSKISSEEDLIRLHKLRTTVDAILVGIETVLADDPLLTVYRIIGRNPDRIVLDSHARTPLTSKVLRQNDSRTIIAVTDNAPKSRIDNLIAAGSEIIMAGSKDQVDLRLLMSILMKKGIKKILVEGGGNVNWSLLELGFVDEMCVAIAPVIVGGKEATTLVEGRGVSKVSDGIKLRLQRIEKYEEDLVLTYKPLIN